MYQHRDLGRRGQADDRRWQARVKVQNTAGFFKAKPVLWLVLVNESGANSRDKAILDDFREQLEADLILSPIIVEDDPVVTSDFFVSVTRAVELLDDAGTPMSDKTIERNLHMITNYKQGRSRMVRWSEIVALAPRRRSDSGKKRAVV